MENVPKIVTDRLRATTVAADHPDAELLTAFSEQLLAEGERSRVLEHLAGCAGCREVVALALPGEETTAQVLRPARGGLLTWPRLRWALVAAGVVVVGSFGLLRYRVSSHPETVALYDFRTQDAAKENRKQAEPAPVPPAASTPVASASEEKAARGLLTSPPPAAKSEADKEFEDSDRLGQFAKLDAPRRDEKALHGAGSNGGRLRIQSLPHGPKGPAQQWQLNVNANTNSTNNANAFQYQAPVPAAPPASVGQQSSNEVTAFGQATPVSKADSAVGGPRVAKNQNQIADLPLNGRSAVTVSSLEANAGAEVARAKPAEAPAANAPTTAAVDAYTVSGATRSNFAASGQLVPESARWAINSVGGLQRSFDQGKTWQDVDVNGGAGAGGAMNLSLAMKSKRAKVSDKERADAKMTPVVFRAVSANGPDVWAGGSDANLYHSNDAGTHWVRVVPSWRGIELTGDIVNLQFADPLHGRIITSSAEIWTTADAGQTWDKQ